MFFKDMRTSGAGAADLDPGAQDEAMANQSHQQWRDELGAYVLGLLSEPERHEVRRHLDRCPDCRREYAELAPLAEVFHGIDGMDGGILSDPPAPSPDLGERIVAHVVAERAKQRHRRRVHSAVVAVALTVVLALGAFALLRDDDAAHLASSDIPVEVSPADVEAEAVLVDHDWGCELRLTTRGLEHGAVYTVTVEPADGPPLAAGTFLGSGKDSVTSVHGTALLAGEVVGFVVEDRWGAAVVRGGVAAD